MNVDIAPFLTYLRVEKDNIVAFASATVFALSATKDQNITANILIDNKTLINNIQISSLTNNKITIKSNEAEYICPSDKFVINSYDHLNNIGICSVDDKSATYILTVEFENKLQLHFLELEDGNYIFAPNEKISWGLNE